MDTLEIDRCLRTDPYTSQFYGGTFPIDLIPKPLQSGRIYVINLDESTQEGSHWVQLATLDGSICYFDSFGQPPPPKIVDDLKGEVIYYCDIPVQSPLSQACGYHVLTVSLLQARGYSLLEILVNCYRAREEHYIRNDLFAAIIISTLTSLEERPLVDLSELAKK